jgi:methylphosphotriester-DNA--protein-cysteine methyltransferase
MRSVRTAVTLAALLLVALTGAAAEKLHGNTRTHVFHQSSCRYYSCPHCTVQFDTAAEAKQKGYRPCGWCTPDAQAKDEANVTTAYVGNTRSHKFHRATCRFATCSNCTAKFATREEALKAGYVPGQCCSP